MSGDFDSRKNSNSTKFEHRPRILVKLTFRELCDSNLFGLRPFDNMTISLIYKRGQALRVHETLMLKVIFVNLIKDSSLVTNGTQGPRKYSHDLKQLQGDSSIPNIALKLLRCLYLTKAWSLLPKLVSLLSDTTVQPENTYSCISRWQVRSKKSRKR